MEIFSNTHLQTCAADTHLNPTSPRTQLLVDRLPLPALAISARVTRLENPENETAWASVDLLGDEGSGAFDWWRSSSEARAFQRKEAWTFMCRYGNIVRWARG